MSFDKAKAMRSAERYVAQGKIRSAIGEYQAVVDHDPRDIATMNMLGDLYAKDSSRREAIECYLKVAEHYAIQGFAQKAIAIYNKVSRLQPDSIEVSVKLAELYKIKGSLSEARSHYEMLAAHYEKTGKRIEALAMWKQIALLDPNNSAVCLNLGDSYLREGQRDEAAEAYCEAGARLARQGSYEEAVRAYRKTLDIRGDDVRALDGLVKGYSALGRVGKAVSHLEEILENEPYNRDVLYMLIDCHVEAQNAAGAEKAVLKLVEIEPANYPKLLELIQIHLNTGDLDAAARILSMSSEYLLAAGQGDDCNHWITQILDRDPQHLATLRLLVRYCSWIKEESSFRVALERLAVAAREVGSAEDERFALAQLVALRPFETTYSERLAELNEQLGDAGQLVDAELIKAQFAAEAVETPMKDFGVIEAAYEAVGPAEFDPVEVETNGHHPAPEAPAPDVEAKLRKEVESIAFYIENDYRDLAEKAIAELEAEYGSRKELDELRLLLSAKSTDAVAASSIGIDEMRSEFGLTENDPPSDEDYETKFHTAVAYQEMGLTEEAIRIFQEAIELVSPNDGTRRFFSCANLIGHCFMQTGHANLAADWFTRALETPGLSAGERHGLWYELGSAYDSAGNSDEAHKYFERVYAEDVDFRDVSERVRSLAVA